MARRPTGVPFLCAQCHPSACICQAKTVFWRRSGKRKARENAFFVSARRLPANRRILRGADKQSVRVTFCKGGVWRGVGRRSDRPGLGGKRSLWNGAGQAFLGFRIFFLPLCL